MKCRHPPSRQSKDLDAQTRTATHQISTHFAHALKKCLSSSLLSIIVSPLFSLFSKIQPLEKEGGHEYKRTKVSTPQGNEKGDHTPTKIELTIKNAIEGGLGGRWRMVQRQGQNRDTDGLGGGGDWGHIHVYTHTQVFAATVVAAATFASSLAGLLAGRLLLKLLVLVHRRTE